MQTIFELIVLIMGLGIATTVVVFASGVSNELLEKAGIAKSQLLDATDIAMDADLTMYKNNPNVSGADVRKLMEFSEAKNVSVLVQTAASNGIVVNYGPVLRPAIDDTTELSNAAYVGTSPTEFEAAFASPVNSLFGGTDQAGATPSSRVVNITSLKNNAPTPGGNKDPHLFIFRPNDMTYNDAVDNNAVYSSLGVLFSDGVTMKGMATNNNFSFARNDTHPYFVNPSATYRVTTALNPQDKSTIFYCEESTVSPNYNVLEQLMKGSGLSIN